MELKKDAQEKISKAFLELIQTKEIDKITVTEIVKKAHINRSTFYVYYMDIYNLADCIKQEMYHNLLELYKEEAISKKHSYNYLKLFEHIKNNQIYYQTLFKLNFDFSVYYDFSLEDEYAMKYLGSHENIDYHIAFFKAGITAIIKKWLQNGCDKDPSELVEIIHNEYKGKSLIKK